MAESFSRRILNVDMADLGEELTALDVLHSLFETERNFYGIVRFLDGATRNNIVAAHMRNMNLALQAIRAIIDTRAPAVTAPSLVMNIDLSGNVLRNFFDPVPVVPTQEQISAATERQIPVTNISCAICQDSIQTATRLRACGHCFHDTCIQQWLNINTRCPVCRHDVREPLTRGEQVNHNEGRRLYPHSG